MKARLAVALAAAMMTLGVGVAAATPSNEPPQEVTVVPELSAQAMGWTWEG